MKKSIKNYGIIAFFYTLILFSPFSLYAQQGIIVRGTIIDEKQEPLIGVNVVVEKSSTGTITDLKGKFSLSVPNANSTITVSYIGYETVILSVGNKRDFRIVLKEYSKMISEVVVVGYGTQKKETLTGAITTVKSADLMKSPVGNVSQALAGRTPGLQIKQGSGQPGYDDANIRIRGIGSLTDASSSPLVLVDGVERSFNQLDPEEIETVTILKDASSTAVYGIRGGNGVIIVTTKRGAKVRQLFHILPMLLSRLPPDYLNH